MVPIHQEVIHCLFLDLNLAMLEVMFWVVFVASNVVPIISRVEGSVFPTNKCCHNAFAHILKV